MQGFVPHDQCMHTTNYRSHWVARRMECAGRLTELRIHGPSLRPKSDYAVAFKNCCEAPESKLGVGLRPEIET